MTELFQAIDALRHDLLWMIGGVGGVLAVVLWTAVRLAIKGLSDSMRRLETKLDSEVSSLRAERLGFQTWINQRGEQIDRAVEDARTARDFAKRAEGRVEQLSAEIAQHRTREHQVRFGSDATGT